MPRCRRRCVARGGLGACRRDPTGRSRSGKQSRTSSSDRRNIAAARHARHGVAIRVETTAGRAVWAAYPKDVRIKLVILRSLRPPPRGLSPRHQRDRKGDSDEFRTPSLAPRAPRRKWTGRGRGATSPGAPCACAPRAVKCRSAAAMPKASERQSRCAYLATRAVRSVRSGLHLSRGIVERTASP